MKFNLSDFFKKDKKVGLALSGGAVYGAAHIGVLKAIEEKEIKVDYISGTSIGAFIASFYAFGVPVKEIEKTMLDLDWLDISSVSLSQFALMSNKKFALLLEEVVGKVKIEDADIPLSMIAADITNGEKVILQEGDLGQAVTASTCIPGLFKPVEVNGKLLVDGGIVENVPVSPLIDRGADHIIAADLNSGLSGKKPGNILEVLLNSFHITLMSVTRDAVNKAQVLINPDLSEFNRYDVKQAPSLIEAGYKSAMEVLSE